MSNIPLSAPDSRTWNSTEQSGLDPHKDTPVEILHVVLLGFVKYFWRDLVQNQVNDEQKQTLVARLNSLNVHGLGIPKLGGATLVTYAGSLTGRDFRAIAQVAPFVIYDMVPGQVYDAWVALSTLVPLIWQPVIDNVDKFCVSRLVSFLYIFVDILCYIDNTRNRNTKLFDQNRPMDFRVVQQSQIPYTSSPAQPHPAFWSCTALCH